MDPKIAQTIEVLKLLQSMDYFSAEEQEYIAKTLIERSLESTPSVPLLPLLLSPKEESLRALNESDLSCIVRGLTHPDLYIHLPTILEELTEFKAAPPSQEAIESMQAENDAE